MLGICFALTEESEKVAQGRLWRNKDFYREYFN